MILFRVCGRGFFVNDELITCYYMKQIFPSSYSTMTELELTGVISDRYKLSVPECRLITKGVGDTYLITSQGIKFILRVYRKSHRTLDHINAEVELLLYLKQHGVSVSHPIEDAFGEHIQSLNAADGTRHAVLFSYAPGESVHNLSYEQLRELGRQMAHFHDVSSVINLKRERWNFDLDSTLYKPLEILETAYANDAEGYVWLKEAADSVKKKLNELNSAEFSMGYCHYDFLPKNFHFDGNALTFFDFDFFGYGCLVNDIMTFWQHLCLDVHFNKITQKEADTAYQIFIASYRKLRPITKAELEAVPYLSLGFWLFYSAFHTTHDQFYAYVQPEQLKLRTNMIKQLMERYWQ